MEPIDGAAGIELFNYLFFVIIMLIISAEKYYVEVRSIEQNLRLMQMNRSLDRLSQTDELTNLNNRLAYRRAFQNALGRTIFMMMMDVNDFKYFNDTFGHTLGDEILRKIADILKEIYGEENCFRFGGDEFLILMPAKGRRTTQKMIDQMNDKIADIAIDQADKTVSCSYGYVIATPESGEQMRKCMKDADEALYEMKEKYHAKTENIEK